MFGYDVGISGGVTSMDDFLEKFFHTVYLNKQKAKENAYCKYDNQGLQLFTSSLYLAGLIATFFASYTTRRFGRRPTMLIAGIFFLVGVTFNAAAQDLAMLIVGRLLLGCGVGFANQAVPLFLSEIAPTRIRGGLNILFQLNITIGILFANLVNYGTSKITPWGWRLSLGLAGIPAVLLTVGSIFLVETPNSLIERGHLEDGKHVLKKIRGTNNVDAEFNELVEASRIAATVKHPFRNLLKRGIGLSLSLPFFCSSSSSVPVSMPLCFMLLCSSRPWDSRTMLHFTLPLLLEPSMYYQLLYLSMRSIKSVEERFFSKQEYRCSSHRSLLQSFWQQV